MDHPSAAPHEGREAVEAEADRWRRTISSRVAIAATAFLCWTGVIEARLVYLQVIRHDDLAMRAERQQLRTIPAPAKRGDILDRHGHVLGYSVDADSIYAVPSEISNPARVASDVCAALDDCTARDRQILAERLGRRRPFAYVRRHVTPEEARRVEALGLVGIATLKESRRYYPKRELAAHLLGFVGIDNTGLGGIEAARDRDIRGRPGQVLIQTDARQRAFSRVERPPTAGASLELTIDEYLQHVTERELRLGVRENRAAGGTAIVMDPHTGEILAMANEPTFNPNVFTDAVDAQKRNRAIQDIYEPGSTFKVITASAALAEDVIRPDHLINVSPGIIRFGSRVISDVHAYGTLSFTDVIVKSSNVGAIKVGLRLGPERMGRYVRRFGFGQRLSPDFSGEAAGIVWDSAKLDDSALASVSMGYQIGVTPLQMTSAVSSVANGGELIEPRVVRAVIRNGRREPVARRVLRRTIDPETAARVTAMLEQVVESGTAQRTAQIEGYTIAGKTGTAAKLVNGAYSKSAYNASFVGFAPSRRPAVTILVVVDSPRANGYYGGSVAAPIFKRIAEAALRHLGVPRNRDPEPPLLVARHGRDTQPVASPAPVLGPAEMPLIAEVSQDVMPELRGLSAREALRRLSRLGVAARMTGDGFVAEQQPEAGTPLGDSPLCVLTLRRRPLPVAGAAMP
jgi:cell division protein FtsI (penicillin-binding protein 3)